MSGNLLFILEPNDPPSLSQDQPGSMLLDSVFSPNIASTTRKRPISPSADQDTLPPLPKLRFKPGQGEDDWSVSLDISEESWPAVVSALARARAPAQSDIGSVSPRSVAGPGPTLTPSPPAPASPCTASSHSPRPAPRPILTPPPPVSPCTTPTIVKRVLRARRQKKKYI